MRISDHQHPIDTGISSKPEATEVVPKCSDCEQYIPAPHPRAADRSARDAGAAVPQRARGRASMREPPQGDPLL